MNRRTITIIVTIGVLATAAFLISPRVVHYQNIPQSTKHIDTSLAAKPVQVSYILKTNASSLPATNAAPVVGSAGAGKEIVPVIPVADGWVAGQLQEGASAAQIENDAKTNITIARKMQEDVEEMRRKYQPPKPVYEQIQEQVALVNKAEREKIDKLTRIAKEGKLPADTDDKSPALNL